jgi:hypothetical protein
VLGLHDGWSREAALLGAALWTRRPAEPGWTPPADAESFARSVLERLTADSALALVEAALARDGVADPAREARGLLPRRAVAGDAPATTLLRPALTLGLPLVGIGASAGTYYPEIARRLGTESVVPEHAGVTNAIGAVASGVLQTVAITITAPEEGRFRVHAPAGIRTFDSLEEAAAHAEWCRWPAASICSSRAPSPRRPPEGRGWGEVRPHPLNVHPFPLLSLPGLTRQSRATRSGIASIPHRHCDPGLEPGEAIQGRSHRPLDCVVGFASSQ